jgi:hypothetical protein
VQDGAGVDEGEEAAAITAGTAAAKAAERCLQVNPNISPKPAMDRIVGSVRLGWSLRDARFTRTVCSPASLSRGGLGGALSQLDNPGSALAWSVLKGEMQGQHALAVKHFVGCVCRRARSS